MATLKLHSWYVQHWPEASYSNADDKPQHWRETTLTFGIAPIGTVGGGLIEYGISDISNNCFLPEDPVVNLTRHTNARSRRLIELFLWAGCTVGIVGAIAGLVLTVTR